MEFNILLTVQSASRWFHYAGEMEFSTVYTPVISV
jgi:hypothetical protein